jgi:hypothetical protein
MADFPVTLDDLKNLYYGVTNPDHWANALAQLQQAKNTMTSAAQKITPPGGSPIPGPPMTLEDVWRRMSAALNTAGRGPTQPVNQSGIR